MDLIERAYKELFGHDNEKYSFYIGYSGKFTAYNANVRLVYNSLKFNLSKKWKDVDEEIVIGLIQELMVKILCRKKSRPHTINMDLYNNFLKSLHISIPKTKSHPMLEESFERINALYFNSLLEKPNLVLGGRNTRTMGSYNYQTDTLTISRILESSPRLLDYVMYHEMLHKHLKFKSRSGRGIHHTYQFRKMEKAYPDAENLEKELSSLVYKWKHRTKAPKFIQRFFFRVK